MANKLNKRLNRFAQNETFEPMLAWGLRMAISAMAPMIWGIVTHRIIDAIWITLTAEAVCWVELKGPFSWQLRTLFTGAFLVLLFSVLGSVTGGNVWLSVICMFFTGFFATLLKNMGDRASGLAICVYLLFILSNGYPATSPAAIEHRILLVCAGAVWTITIGMAVSVITPVQQPFRRQIALIWRSVANLVSTVCKGGDGGAIRGNVRAIYLSERDVRTAIDNSFLFYTSMSHQASKNDKQQYYLAQLRKTAALIAVHVVAMSEETDRLLPENSATALQTKRDELLIALHNAIERMGIFILTLKPEEKLIATSRVNRLKNLIAQLKQYPLPDDKAQAKTAGRLIQLNERCAKLIENAVTLIGQMGEDLPVFRSYSFIKTLFILNPKFLFNNIRSLFNFSSQTTRYALRSAIAVAIALFIYKWYHIEHGYWLPFSVMIVMQSYFGATFKKATDRIIGTLLGGLTGSLCLLFPNGMHIKAAILFITFILMVYYLRKQYAIAAFVITVNVVLLFNLEAPIQPMLIVTRAICTVGGAGLAVLSGFLLLPTWDKKKLPAYLANAIQCNYVYFVSAFFSTNPLESWVRNKRSVETKNGNVFDSFNRFLHEPGGKEDSALFYGLITCNIRITRYLNDIFAEQEERQTTIKEQAPPGQQKGINECLYWFNRNIQLLGAVAPAIHGSSMEIKEGYVSPFRLTESQLTVLAKILIELKTMNQDIEKLANTPHIE